MTDDDDAWMEHDDAWMEHCAAMEAEVARLESTPRPAGLHVWTEYGTEGPRHDPWSFTDIMVILHGGRRFRYHGGLDERLNGGTGEEWEARHGRWRDMPEICRGDGCRATFEALVGFDSELLEYWADAPYRGIPCMACGAEGCRGGCCI